MFCLPAASINAQDSPPPPAYPTINSSVSVTAGNTFQQALAAIPQGSHARRSLTIQNNNTGTDNCFVYLGTTAAANAAGTGKAVLLQPGQSYQRYYPYVPSDGVQVTCANASDTVYVDNQ